MQRHREYVGSNNKKFVPSRHEDMIRGSQDGVSVREQTGEMRIDEDDPASQTDGQGDLLHHTHGRANA